MVTFTEGTAARKFENFFGFISEAEEGVKSKFMAPFFVMTGALFGFGAGIAGTLGENWSDPLHVKEWAYWIGGLSATLAVSFWIAQRLESPDTTPK